MGAAPTPAVRLRGAVCLLGRFPALAGVDLDVARGEVVVVRGANGAGKSTLLRVLAGLAPIVEGAAVVLGHDLRADRRHVRAQVGMLGHASPLYDDLTVVENVTFWARATGRGRRSHDPHAALERLGLTGRLADVPAARLSAGQRRRVALAVLMARHPELWLLDEPHAGLDAAARDVVDEVVADASRRGATVVVASHEVDRSARLAARTVMLAGGRVMAGTGAGSASPAAAHREPAGVA